MKKLGLIAAVLSVGCLAGCFGGKDANESKAIDLAKQQNIATIKGSNALQADMTTEIGHDSKGFFNNDYIVLTTKQVVASRDLGKEYTVDIEWEFDRNDSFFLDYRDRDDEHKTLNFKYQKGQTHDYSFSATFKCGKTTSSDKMNFTVKLLDKNLEFEKVSIAQLLEVNDAGTTYKLVDPDKLFYRQNNFEKVNGEEFKYMLVEVTGKVIYTAPDGNWGLIADGDNAMEIYAGGQVSNLTPAKQPYLANGNVVTILGEVASYCGNVQLSYIFDIYLGDPASITEPTGFRALNEADFSGKYYFQNCLSNSLRSVSGKYNGNLQKDGAAASVSDLRSGSRFTFDILVGSTTLKVAYDYHTDKSGDKGLFDALKNKLSSLNVGDSVSFDGTVRFAGKDVKDDKSFKPQVGLTDWSIVPFLAEHVK